jgi:pimeloyl-ACP methyl ester carboxylesterase
MGIDRRRFLQVASLAAAVSTISRATKAEPASLEVVVWGSGPRVVLVHGSVQNGPMTWKEQRPLGQRWGLEVLNRRGYGNSPQPALRSDFEEDARDIATLLGGGAHLVGHSYGAIGALYAAALRPQAVRSLVVNEPPAFRLLRGDPAADAIVAAQAALKRDAEPRAFLEAFLSTITGPGTPPRPTFPDPLPPALEQGVRTTMLARPQGEAEIPLDALRQTSFPKLVTSGGHHPVFEGICDELHRELKTERAIIRGAGHNVPFTGAPFNDRLEAFLKSA